jgi:L-threonylcarbamoyladenylate synthase
MGAGTAGRGYPRRRPARAGGPAPAWRLREAARVLGAGGLVAYPTEAVFGVGCDPWNPGALGRLLALKRRPEAKGLILIAADLRQLEVLVQTGGADWAAACATWPGFVTWVLRAAPSAPPWLGVGRPRTLAVRVTAHPVAAGLCRAFGSALVSTSANLSGRPPARTVLAVRRAFPRGLDLIVHGPLGGEARPSPIRDGETGRVVRP